MLYIIKNAYTESKTPEPDKSESLPAGPEFLTL